VESGAFIATPEIPDSVALHPGYAFSLQVWGVYSGDSRQKHSGMSATIKILALK